MMYDNQMISRAKQRLPGIDLAKVVAMFLVVVHHISDCGLGAPIPGSCTALTKEMLFSVSCSCIDIFAITTGFSCISSDFRVSRLCGLWLSAVFWGGVMFGAACAILGVSPGFRSFLSVCLPVSRNQYWYFTMYFGLFFLMPILNAGIKSLSREMLRVVLIFSFVVFSVVPFFACRDLFRLNGGYSMAWLALLYIVGAYIRLYRPFSNVFASKFLVCVVLLMMVCCLKPSLQMLIGRHIPGDCLRLIGYTSPFTLCIALCIFNACLNIKVCNSRCVELLKLMSATTFGIYLIHCQPLFWSEVMAKNLARIVPSNPLTHFLTVLALCIPMYLLMTLMDFGRIKAFGILRVDSMLRRIDDILNRKVG